MPLPINTCRLTFDKIFYTSVVVVATKAILSITGIAAVGASGAVAYAWYDPQFRAKIEDAVPQSKGLLEKILGDPRDTSKPVTEDQNIKKITQRISSALPAKKEPQDQKQIINEDDLKAQSSQPSAPNQGDDTSRTTASVKQDNKKEQNFEDNEEQYEKESNLQKRWKARDEELEKAKKKLEQRLQPLVSRMEDAVKTAIDAKLKAVAATEISTKRIRKAVDASNPDEEPTLEKTAREEYESVKQATKISESLDSEARAQLERLRAAINEGIASKETSDHPILTDVSRALNYWNYQLNEATSRVTEAQTEYTITTEFKKLVEQGREQFAKELKAILPNVDIHAKGKKLTEDELNALIAHAHVRVDQLRRQLSEQQLREQQHIQQACERQKSEDARLMQDKVENALSTCRSEHDVKTRLKLQEAKAEFEDELRKQMKRQAAAHSEHLEEVVKNLQFRSAAYYKRELDEALVKERDFYSREVATSVARLYAIENALEGRTEQDSESRRSKDLWLACQQLKKAVVYGRAAGKDYASRRKPLVKEIMAVKLAGVVDPFVKTLIASVKSEVASDGVFTQEDLIERFQRVKNLCHRTSLIGDNGGTLFQYFLSFLQSLFLFERAVPTVSQVDEIDPTSIDAFSVVRRANHYVNQSDFESAIKILLLLKGQPAQIASDWIRDAQLHLEIKRTAELLLAHASALSIRAVY